MKDVKVNGLHFMNGGNMQGLVISCAKAFNVKFNVMQRAEPVHRPSRRRLRIQSGSPTGKVRLTTKPVRS